MSGFLGAGEPARGDARNSGGDAVDAMTFEDLVGDRRAFLAEYFQRAALFRAGAAVDHLGQLVSIRELLDEVVALEALPAGYVRLVKGGKPVPRARFTRTVMGSAGAPSEVLRPDRIRQQFSAGATVVCNYLNRVLPSMRRLAGMLGDAFACQSEVVAFLTPEQSTGLAPHRDPVDVFVVHVEGSKDWRVWDPPRPGVEPVPLAELGEPSFEAVLRPGDVLYIPAGAPHVAASSGTAALHVSLSVEPRRWRDLLRECVEALTADDRYHRFPYLGDGADGPATAAEFTEKIGLLRAQLADLDPATELKRLTGGG